MANKTQLAAQIRFELEQLSIRNEHHDFEQLCLYLTQKRICSNVIPSTGPVSAGGDYGKDFQTFTTYLHDSGFSNSTFIGLASKKPIVFACSLQKDNIESKIKSDVAKITNNGTQIELERIYFFCVTDIQVSKNEELKTWSKRTYGVQLEIMDGQALSLILTDSDVFWIASQYLHIPSEIYPRFDNEPNWYSEVIAFWKTGNKPKNYADFFELKLAVRYSAENSDIQQDLPFWIDLMENFAAEGMPQSLQRSARYEIAIASFCGLGTLRGQEENLRIFFGDIPNLQRVEALDDTVTLLNYCIGAVLRGIVEITPGEVTIWSKQLTDKVIEKLHAARTANQKCPLLEVMGRLSLQLNIETRAKPQWDQAIKWWTRMIDIAGEAPFFPLERFADRLTKYARFMGDYDGYESLSQQTDLLLSKRSGDAKSAEKARDRAIEFLENGKPIEAINQLHKAKVKWFSEETMHGSLLCMLVIAESYKKLGLLFAAKYYALAVASIAIDSPKAEIKPLTAKALSIAAECDYDGGYWCSFLDIVKLQLNADAEFAKRESTENMPGELERMLFGIGMVHSMGRILDKDLEPYLEKKVKDDLQLPNWVMQIINEAYLSWHKKSTDEIWADMEEQMWGRPFGDLGEKRTTTWSELGITWTVSWANDYATTASAEQFIAAFQIMLADISNEDLCLLKTAVKINLNYADIGVKEMKKPASNNGREWSIVFPRIDEKDWQAIQSDILSAAFVILNEVSLIPNQKYYEIIECHFKNELSTKTFVAKPYQRLYVESYNKESFDSSNRWKMNVPESQRTFKVRESESLSWKSGPGPGYSKEEAISLLKRRYDNSLLQIRRTLKELQKDSGFAATVEKIRKEGWLDWHILNSIANIATSYRVRQQLGAPVSLKEQRDLFIKLSKIPESADSTPVPITEFSEERIKEGFQNLILSNIKGLGLELRQEYPDFKGVINFLRYRYNYWTDDIAHDNPFVNNEN